MHTAAALHSRPSIKLISKCVMTVFVSKRVGPIAAAPFSDEHVNKVECCPLCFQEREANLDVVMDRMRQDATEEALRDSLGKALEMLEKISES